MMEVLPLVTDVMLRLGERRDGLAPPVAALLAPRHRTLAAAQIGFGFAALR
jgi:hypothetical protein